MKVITEGHEYRADNFDDKDSGVSINFIHKVPVSEGSTELKTLKDGTTNEEVLRILIDRMNFLNSKFLCRENAITITKLEEALMWLEKRTRDRVEREVEGKNEE